MTIDAENLIRIDEEVKKKFPGMKVGAAVIEGVEVKRELKELEEYKKKVLKELEIENLSEIPSIKAYRSCFKAFGADPHSRRPSVEALLYRVISGKGLYLVNNVVDAYNIAVIESKIALGAFDLDKLKLPKVLRFARQGEEIFLLGDDKSTLIHEGELIYADQEGPLTLDLNYRDCDRTKITNETKNVLLVADGCDGIDQKEVEKGLDLGCELITRFAHGKIISKKIYE